MPETVESRLARTLKAAGELVTDPPGDLVPAVQRRRRERTRRHAQAVFAAAAVIAVVAGSSLAVDRLRADGPVTRPSPTPSTSPTVVSAQQARPGAISRFPTRSADGLTHRPALAVDATRVLLLTGPEGADATRMDLLDTLSGAITTVTNLDPAVAVPSILASDGRYVVWSGDVDGHKEMWQARLSGGPARRLLRFDYSDDAPNSMVIRDGQVIWLGPGLFPSILAVPVDGGTLEQLGSAMSQGRNPTVWPWMMLLDPTSGKAGTLTDLFTGETVPIIPADGVELFECGPKWCTGTETDPAHPWGHYASTTPVAGPGDPATDEMYVTFDTVPRGMPTEALPKPLLNIEILIQRPDGSGFQKPPLTGFAWLVHGGSLIADTHHRFFNPERNQLITLDDLIQVPDTVKWTNDLVYGRNADSTTSWLMNLKAID
ncbi:hypothetical protein [Acrocarpospora catenulata]|uniref:hypothetical protein n=1 Tax=Acrocarpospora catenulata TaxID=2836182 RepID=UPI001BDA129B|nr:hypothetical protein [Acrocarpospora catenulata]